MKKSCHVITKLWGKTFFKFIFYVYYANIFLSIIVTVYGFGGNHNGAG